MKSPDQFIVKSAFNKRYNNTREIGGVDFVVSSSQEDHKFSSREAIVIETPLQYEGPIKKGDTLLVHHNVFKFYNDMYGRQKSGKSFIKDDIFLIDNEQFFLYKQDGKWKPYDRYCFVKPIKVLNNLAIDKMCEYEPLMGIMKYPNEYLMSQGVNKEDKVSFTPDMEYEFYVDGELLYRVFDHQITLKL